MSYQRVIPRDLFNEAKLLKCLGKLALIIHNGVGVKPFLKLEHDYPAAGFIIEQDPSDGSISCKNLRLTWLGHPVILYSPLNSRRSWPLMYDNDELCECGDVFDENEELSGEFRRMLDQMSRLLGATRTILPVPEPLAELDVVELLINKYSLPPGSVGTVVHVYTGGGAYEVEFQRGSTSHVVTLPRNGIRKHAPPDKKET